MSQPHRLCHVDDIPLGEGREFAVAGKVIAVFHTDEGYHAMDGLCPHAGGPIGTGTLRNGIVTCPWHGWQFDVRTGQHCLSESVKTTTYPVTVEDENLIIAIEE